MLVTKSSPTLCDLMDCSPTRVICSWYFPGKNTEVGSHFLLQGIFSYIYWLQLSLMYWNEPCVVLDILKSICCSLTQSCLTLCDPMDLSMSGFPVLHHLLELAQTHVHWVSDTIQESCPLSFPFLSAFGLFQHQVLSNESSFPIRISTSNEYSGLISFRIDWFDLLAVQGTLKSHLQHQSAPTWKHQLFSTQPFLWSNYHTHIWLLEKP